MKIKTYEEMVESIKKFEEDRNKECGQLEAAAAEVAQARQRLNGLLDKALENPEEYAADVGTAQGMVTIAETRLQRLQDKLEAENSTPGKGFPSGITVAFQNVQGEIRRKIADGSLLQEEFQPILDELNEHRKAYLIRLKAVFIKMHEVNKNLAHIQRSTNSAVQRYTGEEVRYGIMGPEALSDSDFKAWAWVYQYAYDNELTEIRKAAYEAVNPEHVIQPPYVPNKIVPKSEVLQNSKQL